MRAEQAGECLGLGLAQLGELLGDVSHRAVVLADLLAESAARSGADARDVAVGGEGFGEHGSAVGRGRRGDAAVVALLQLGDPAGRELLDCFRARRLGEEPQGGRGEVVVGLEEVVPAGVGDGEDLGRTAATPLGLTARLGRRDETVRDQRVEVSAHRGRGQFKLKGQVSGGAAAVREDRARDPFAGAGGDVLDRTQVAAGHLGDGLLGSVIDPDGFHNTYVT